MRRVLLRVGLPVLAVVGVLWAGVQSRYHRNVRLSNLAQGETQTVSIGFLPTSVAWKISGNLNGSGTVMVPYLYSNRVSGPFSASGRRDYYTTNVSVQFIPDGKASGEIQASFRFHEW